MQFWNALPLQYTALNIPMNIYDADSTEQSDGFSYSQTPTDPVNHVKVLNVFALANKDWTNAVWQILICYCIDVCGIESLVT